MRDAGLRVDVRIEGQVLGSGRRRPDRLRIVRRG
jgi:hypothetical protein